MVHSIVAFSLGFGLNLLLAASVEVFGKLSPVFPVAFHKLAWI